MPTPICLPCIGIPCDNPPDLAAGIDGAIYSALDYSFIVDCPDGCVCEAGLFPQTISILASTIPPVIPPISEPGGQIILRLQGCSSLITRTLAAGSTQAQIAAAAQSMQAEWAGQQALCIARAMAGVNCQGADATSIEVCNDEQSFICPYSGPVIVLARTYCQTLITTGLTQAQIDAAVAAIKANLNDNAHNSVCLKIVCSFNVVTTSPFGGLWEIDTVMQNQGSTDFDSSRFCLIVEPTAPFVQCGISGGGGGIVAPSTSQPGPGLFGALSHRFQITLDGVIIFDQPNTPNTKFVVTVGLNCEN